MGWGYGLSMILTSSVSVSSTSLSIVMAFLGAKSGLDPLSDSENSEEAETKA